MPEIILTKLLRESRAGVLAAGALVALVLSGCATAVFAPSLPGTSEFVQRGISQTKNAVEITASVPSAKEVELLTGIDMYADGIQPIWLRVENNGDQSVRVALLSIDENYFSPLEVAWIYRKQFASGSRSDMERWFVENSLPRRVPPGQSRSGFVFTHASVGTKGFNVDVYADRQSMNFTFFVPLPGFRPDYMDVDFLEIYGAEEVVRIEFPVLREHIDRAICCTSDVSGQLSGDPLNVVIVGTPTAIRRSLLRGGWQETETGSELTRLARSHYHRGRQPDGTFHMARPDGGERKELRLWLTPIIAGTESVWVGHVSYDMKGSLFIRELSDYQVDPDVDAARMFLLQNFWYSQSLRGFSMARGVGAADIGAPRKNFVGNDYFTDGKRVVLQVSEEPVAMDETEIIIWEPLGND